MPTYEYKCTDCHYDHEVFHSISQKPLTDCPKCLKPTLKRLIGGKQATFNFKGDGFYLTDYCKGKESPPKKSEES